MKSSNTADFTKKAKQVHGNIYDYSKVNYINLNTKVEIICPIHGSFLQSPSDHIHSSHGCPVCGGTHRLSTSEFIRRAKQVHGNKYDYSKVCYKNMRTKVIIICPVHGKFQQLPKDHLNRGAGCPFCNRNFPLTTETFIERAKQVHGNKYDYSKARYINGRTPITIICPIHGEFCQRPDPHIYQKCGCPKCKESNGEKEIRVWLESHHIIYKTEYKFSGCKYKKLLPFDFYLPDYNICIEFDGEHHFKANPYFKTSTLEETQKRNRIKDDYCIENNIELIRIPYKSFPNIDTILTHSVLNK